MSTISLSMSTMGTLQSWALFQIATTVADDLYVITITDPWYKETGGNWEEPSLQNQSSSFNNLMKSIKTKGIVTPQTWLENGSEAISNKRGVCTDCAGAAAYTFIDKLKQRSDLYPVRIEVVSTGKHAFVVVGRANGSQITEPGNWGASCFVIDVWMQNQYPKGVQPGVNWMSDTNNNIISFVIGNAKRLKSDAEWILQ